MDAAAADPEDERAVSHDALATAYEEDADAGGEAPSSSASDEPLVLGRYQLGERIAAGAAGSVIAAQDVRSSRQVVVKFFDASEDSYGPWADEMRLAMRLRHRNIVPCLNTGYDRTHRMWALVFERQQGGTLRRALLEKRPIHRLGVLRDVARALAHAHAQGVIHRDVKPENVLARSRAADSQWLLTDFGAGRFLPRGEKARSLAGSLGYIAPEVFAGAATPAADQYSLGAMGWELLFGRGELPSPELCQRFAAEASGAPGLSGVVSRMLRTEPQDRYESMLAALSALEAVPAPALQPSGRATAGDRTEDDKMQVLRRYLQRQHGLTDADLAALEQEWNGHGSYAEFLLRRGLLDRTAARTFEAARKGYLKVADEELLGMLLRNRSRPPRAVERAVDRPSSRPPSLTSAAAAERTVTVPPASPPAEPSIEAAAPEASPYEPAAAAVAEASPQPLPEPAPEPVAEPVPVEAEPARDPSEDLASAATAPQSSFEPDPAPAVVVRDPTPAPRSLPLETGARIGRYLLQERLGEGTTAVIFRSYHELLNIPVALKLFRSLGPLAAGDTDAGRRFSAEAQTLIRLEHQNIVRVLDVDLDVQSGCPYIVFEYVGELTLESLIERSGKLSARQVAHVGMQVADALAAAWAQGILHRDVKPATIQAEAAAPRSIRSTPRRAMPATERAAAVERAARGSAATQEARAL